MRKIICIANQKGGVGKTTTAVNLAACLGVAERKTLLIDCDAQGNATSGMGVDKNQIASQNLYHALLGQISLQDSIIPTQITNLDLIPSTQDLVGIEVEFIHFEDREKRLRNFLRTLEKPYDYIILDCPPSLGFMTINALVAAGSLIIPLQCEYYAMEGLGQLLNTLKVVQGHMNPMLRLGGIVLTMFDARNLLAHKVSEDVRHHFGENVFKTVIPRNVRLSESPSHGLPIILYDVRSRGAMSYMELTKEIIDCGRI